ncbi:conserved Plasmodium protein, unknown function [Plasmodium reichenowi]|uniref:Uncharacterized protein n=1 Tax=Plasmodium reichenowi TaxID=5854 RepID=A0A2P9D4D1_PLARE|nr:conserved Plasmodium protein, unknown function [Plasmodium reichenowi]
MYFLLRKTLNFDNFKDIKLDLGDKINTTDNLCSFEENEVFNFLKYKESTSSKLDKNSPNNSESTLSCVQKELKRINTLKCYLNEIMNFSDDDKPDLGVTEINNIEEENENVSSFHLNNVNNENVCKQKEIETIGKLKNSGKHTKKINKVLSNSTFYKTLSKRINKNEILNKGRFLKKNLLNYNCKIYNKRNPNKKVNICNFKIIRCKSSAYINYYYYYHYGGKYSLEKKEIKNARCYLKKRNFYNVCLIKRGIKNSKLNEKYKRSFFNENFIENNMNEYCFNKEKLYLKEDKSNLNNELKNYVDNNTMNNEGLLNANVTLIKTQKHSNQNMNAICLEPKTNYFQSWIYKKKEFKVGTPNYINTCNMKKTNHEKENKKKSDKFYYNSHLSKLNNAEYKNYYFKKEKNNGKLNELNKVRDSTKSKSNLKNFNLSIFRRFSTNNHCNNKNNLKENDRTRFHFLSNNINYYGTLIKKEEHIEKRITNKDNNIHFFNKKVVIPNKEMKEIKDKIKTALISLNTIKKNNYKLKFCLEKEILDNTIQHNELKKSICSLFSDKFLQRTKVESNEYNKEENEKNKKYNNNNNNNNNENNKNAKYDIEKEEENIYGQVIKADNINILYNNLNNKNENKNINIKIHHDLIYEEKERKNKEQLCSNDNDNINNWNTYTFFNNNMNKKKKEHTNFQYDNKEEWEKIQNKNNIVINNHGQNNSFVEINMEKEKDKEKEKKNIFSESNSYEFFGIKQIYKNNKKVKGNKEFIFKDNITKNENNLYKQNIMQSNNNLKEHNIDYDDEYNKKEYDSYFLDNEKNNSLINFGNIKQSKENYYETNKYPNHVHTNYTFDEFFWNKKSHNYYDQMNMNNNKTCLNFTNKNNESLFDKKYLNKTYINNLTKSYCENKENNYDIGYNSFVNSSTYKFFEPSNLGKIEKEKKNFDLQNVRNIKKIINSDIYVNNQFERINKRNKIVINIIENYLIDKTTSLQLSKEKDNIYMKKNFHIENIYKKKMSKNLPGLYDHYAFLLLNQNKCEVR